MALLGVVAAVSVVVAVVALGVLHEARNHAGAPPVRSALPKVPSSPPPRAYLPLGRLLAGLPQAGNRLGSAHAPVSVVLFADLGCDACRILAQKQLPALIRDAVRSGDVKLIFRALCTSSCSIGNRKGFDRRQRAALAAGAQHLFWNYALLALAEQGYPGSKQATAGYLRSLANQIPSLNLAQWQHDRNRPEVGAALTGDAHLAAASSIFATPTLVVSGPRKRNLKIVGVPSTLKQVTRAIQQAR